MSSCPDERFTLLLGVKLLAPARAVDLGVENPTLLSVDLPFLRFLLLHPSKARLTPRPNL